MDKGQGYRSTDPIDIKHNHRQVLSMQEINGQISTKM